MWQFLINWILKRQLKKFEHRWTGTGSSVTFRQEPLLRQRADDE